MIVTGSKLSCLSAIAQLALLMTALSPCVLADFGDPCVEGEKLITLDFDFKGIEQFDGDSLNVDVSIANGDRLQAFVGSFEVPPEQLTVCVPANTCFKVYVDLNLDEETYRDHGLPSVVISHEDEGFLNLRGPFFRNFKFQAIVYAESAACEVTCEQGEALFELEVLAPWMYDYDWRISETNDLSSVVTTCDETQDFTLCSENYKKFAVERRCLPVDGCYTFVAGSSYFTLRSHSGNMNITYNGDRLLTEQDPYFASLDFGSGECQAACEGESTLELFVYRQRVLYDFQEESFPNINWSITTINRAGDLEDISSNQGLIQKGLGITEPLTYHRECVMAASSCSETKLLLDINQLPEEQRANYSEYDSMRLVVDGVVHGDDTFYFESDRDGQASSPWEHVEYAGKGCLKEDLCSSDDDEGVPVGVEFSIGSKEEEFWEINEIDINYVGSTIYIPLYSGYFPEKSYRFVQCIIPAEGECAMFGVSKYDLDNGLITDYDIFVNGVLEEEKVDCKIRIDGVLRECGNFEKATIISGDCDFSNPLSTGAIVGIALAGLVVLLVLVGLIMKKQPSQGDDSNTNRVEHKGEDNSKENSAESDYA